MLALSTSKPKILRKLLSNDSLDNFYLKNKKLTVFYAVRIHTALQKVENGSFILQNIIVIIQNRSHKDGNTNFLDEKLDISCLKKYRNFRLLFVTNYMNTALKISQKRELQSRK